ncbi:MAG: hypothetical protein IJE57_03450 [Anaerotignum sp.]|nr:hypothetical protein [Anaerotignum sp.]
MGFAELWKRAMEKKFKKTCPDCGGVGTLEYADDSVLVCSNCGYSIDDEDLSSEWLEKLENEQ